MIDCTTCGKRHRELTAEQCTDRKMTERTLQARVLYRARKYGWKASHAGRGLTAGGWVTQSSPGLPDLMLAKAGHSLLFFELKREQGDVEPEQYDWLRLLRRCGVDAAIIRPSSLRNGYVDARLSQPEEFRPPES